MPDNVTTRTLRNYYESLPNGAPAKVIGQDLTAGVYAAPTVFSTRIELTQSIVNSSIYTVFTGAYSAVGDGGADQFARRDSEPSSPFKVQSLDGAWWESISPVTHLEALGAKADGTTNCSASLQTALTSSRPIELIGAGEYYVPGSLTCTTDGVTIYGSERSVLRLGGGLSAGGTAITVSANKFTAKGFSLKADVRVDAFKVTPASANLSKFRFQNLSFDGFFYDIRTGLSAPAAYTVKDIHIVGCRCVAPAGVNAGHFFCASSADIVVSGNKVEGGYNTSVYGFANCTGKIAVTGNIESGVSDTAGTAEAACQVEDCATARTTISGNSFSHDIWVAGSKNVDISGNSCRRLRLSYGNVGGYDVQNVVFSGNIAGSIYIEKFGAAVVSEKIKGATFTNNNLDPAGFTYFGAPINQAVYIVGGDVDGRIRMQGNRIISSAAVESCRISRSSTFVLEAFDNDLGTQPHVISGSGGVIYEQNNRNALFPAGNGYISVYAAANPIMSLSAWTVLPLAAEIVDVNAEWTSNLFTPTETGRYAFIGRVLVDPDALGSQFGLRLYRTTGTAAELLRLSYNVAPDGNFLCSVFATDSILLTPSDSVRIEYFATGATTQILGAQIWCNLQVKRIG